MKIIWADTIVEESNLDHYLHVLRKTLGQKNDGQPFIETLRRRGYRFTSDVRVSEAPNRNGTRLAPEIRILLNSRIEMRVRRVRQVWPPVTYRYIVKRSRFSPLLGASPCWRLIRVGGDLVFSAAGSSKPETSPPRGEVSVTPLTNGHAPSDATISPDGKYFVYYELIDNKQHLWVQQVGQTDRIEITPPGEWTIQWMTFSPNAEFVYFVAQEKAERPTCAISGFDARQCAVENLDWR